MAFACCRVHVWATTPSRRGGVGWVGVRRFVRSMLSFILHFVRSMTVCFFARVRVLAFSRVRVRVFRRGRCHRSISLAGLSSWLRKLATSR
jgi:hypothetical protein